MLSRIHPDSCASIIQGIAKFNQDSTRTVLVLPRRMNFSYPGLLMQSGHDMQKVLRREGGMDGETKKYLTRAA